VITPEERRARRRAHKRRGMKRLRRLVLIVVLAAAGSVAALLVGNGGGSPRPSAVDSVSTAKPPQRIVPPGPIPGYLLFADRGNNRLLLVDGAKHVLWEYPKGTPALAFRFDDDAFFGPKLDRIISNQEDQHTIQIISFPAGRVLWWYGHVNVQGGAPGYLRTPDDAYLLPSGLVTVADAYNCRVLFIDHAHRIVRQYGTTGVCRHDPPRLLGAVNGATPLPDGGTLVSEINGSWIDDIGPDGRLRWAVQAPVSYPSDPQQLAPNRILLADYTRPGHVLIMNRSGTVLWRYGPSSGPGALDHPSLAARFAPGLIAVNDDFRHRVVFISIRTHRIVWQYGHTDTPGTSRDFVHTPDGMDFLTAAQVQATPAIRALVTRSTAAAVQAGRGPHVAPAGFSLPAPVEREVAAATPSGVVIAGGLDAAQHSTRGVFLLDPSSGALRSLGSVPEAFHDAAGTVLGQRLLVFGGGAAQSSSSVQEFDLVTHRGRIAAHLPQALSDLAAATVGGTVYLFGGYDGRRPRPEIYATRDGIHFSVAGRLPVGLRYPAVAAVGGLVVIAGGTSSGGPVSTVYVFDPGSGRVTALGRLPNPAAHAAAVALGGSVYVLGGSPPVSASVDVRRRMVAALSAAVPVADAAVAALGGRALLIGGSSGGRTVGQVRVVTP
jgi:hypothetical protein